MEAFLGLLADPKVLVLLSPVLVSLVKKVTDSLPKWSLPVISTVCGVVLSALAGGDLATGAAAGLAGVGVREILDQGKKAVSG